ncbi:putative transposon, En/Spm-like protein [Tanacetum coccineum]
MPTKIELTLEQSQQGVSNDVLILTLLSWETCQRDFSESLPDHWYSYYTIIGEIGGLDDGAVAASFQRSRIHKPHAHTQAFKVNQCNKYEHVVKKHKLINGGQIKMFKSKEVDADNDLKNSKSKDKGSRSSSTKANDSHAWRTIYEKFPEIAEDPRNLRLGILADGVDVNIGNRHHRVDTYDASTKDNFNLRAVMLWTINDYPALGTLCGCPYSGFKGCVVCGKDTNCVRLSALSKQKDTRGRGGKIQKQKRNTTEEEGSSSQVNRQNGAYWKKFNIWYRKLRYWRHHSVPHCIDFMHVEKNVAESLVGTLLNVSGKTKDGVNARLDLAELGVKPELFAMQEEDKTTLPPAGYTLTNAEKDIFCETLYNIRVPQGYCSNFSSLVSLKDRKLIGLKSHDYHMLMQEFLPIAIRSIMHPATRYAIIRFCFFFKSICSKEIRLQELDKMQAELVVTLCLLEKFFPLSFFDIMVHLTVHLTREVKLCGPICFRWMYPFERCMKVIKGHVRNRNKLEGCIAEETIAEETIELFSEYHKTMETIGIPPDKHETDENEEGKPLSAGKSSEVSTKLFKKAHLYVIQNTDELVPYIERHKQVLKTETWVERELAIDKESVSETVRWISYGPRATVVKYDAYNINGYTFRTKCHDGKVYQNSGVSVEAIDLHISKEVATTRQAYYYGVLQEIWVLDYRFRQIPLFKCDWVNHKSGGVKRDKLGYTLVDLNNLGHKVDLFILASQALQVFYVKDLVDKKLSIVFKTPPKNYKDTYDEVDEEFSTVIHHRNDNVLPLVDRRDLANESRDDYYRKDCGGVVIRKSKLDKYYMKVLLLILNDSRLYKTGKLVHTARLNLILLRIENIVVNLDSSSDNNNSDSYSTSQISTSEEIDYDSSEPPKSLLKWYHYLSDEYKNNGGFWGSKSGYNESDVKLSWKDIEKAKACMLAKAQAFEASSKAKVKACGSKAKLQELTKTLIVKSLVPITNFVLELANAKTMDAINGKTFRVKIQ